MILNQYWVCKVKENGMGTTREIIVLYRINWCIGGGGVEAVTLLKTGLRGTCMLECYFVKIEMYLGAEIVMIYSIYQDLILKKRIFSTTTWIILSFVLHTRHIIKCIRYSS